jgi:hypothetical protein
MLSVLTLRAPNVFNNETTPCPKKSPCITERKIQAECTGLNLSQVPVSSELKSFKKMDLSCKCIKKVWADFFEGCNNLSVLIMKECNIETIVFDAFHSLKNLETIDLSHNYLASIPPNLFTQNRRLKDVSLSHNPLTMLQYDAPILVSSSLLHLRMDNCMISELSNTSLSQLPNLQSLDLSSNGLKVLTADTLLPLEHLNNIKLGGNNWICNNVFERLVCFVYNISNSQPHNMKCLMKNGGRKVYNSHELCRKLSATTSTVASITSTPKELVDVTTDMTLRTSLNLFQNTSQEYTTTVLQENIHKRSNESDKAFTIIISTDPPRTNDNKGMENSEEGTPYSTLVVDTQATSEDELRTTPESKTGGGNSLLKVDVILPILFGVVLVVMSVCLIAVYYVKNRGMVHHPQYYIKGEASHVTPHSDNELRLLNPQLRDDFTIQGPGQVNSSDVVGGSEQCA